jgi:general secretion pathway protein A
MSASSPTHTDPNTFWQYYGLRENPFGATPDPRYLYLGEAHGEALASLIHGIENGRGFLAMIAAPGMGKTTLLRLLLERFRQSAQTAFLFYTQCTSLELIRFLMADVGLEFEADLVSVLQEFHRMLLSGAANRKPLLVFIDEAQNLDETVLETIRILSNFETPQSKLLQIVLFGQEALETKLKNPSLVQLRQRLSQVVHVRPLDGKGCSKYLSHRLAVAGYNGPELFEPRARDLLISESCGIPRRLNSLCLGALALGCALRVKLIHEPIVHEVISNLALGNLFSPPSTIPFANSSLSWRQRTMF